MSATESMLRTVMVMGMHFVPTMSMIVMTMMTVMPVMPMMPMMTTMIMSGPITFITDYTPTNRGIIVPRVVGLPGVNAVAARKDVIVIVVIIVVRVIMRMVVTSPTAPRRSCSSERWVVSGIDSAVVNVIPPVGWVTGLSNHVRDPPWTHDPSAEALTMIWIKPTSTDLWLPIRTISIPQIRVDRVVDAWLPTPFSSWMAAIQSSFAIVTWRVAGFFVLNVSHCFAESKFWHWKEALRWHRVSCS